MLRVSWREHRTNESVLMEVGIVRQLRPNLAKLKLQYFAHTLRESAGELLMCMLVEGVVVSTT